MNNDARKKTIFWRVLAGYVFLTFFVLTLTGSVFFMIVKRYIEVSNTTDLTRKAATVAQMLSRPDGRIRYLTRGGLYELESMCDAQILYVDSNMVVRRMRARRAKRAGDQEAGAEAHTGEDEIPIEDEDEIEDDDSSKDERPLPPINDILRILNRYDIPEYYSAASEDAIGRRQSEENASLERVDLSGTLDEALVRSIMSGEVATDIRRIHFLDSLVMFAGMPITDVESGRTVAAIILCRSIGEIDDMSRRMIDLIALSGVVALMCAAAIAYFMSRNLTRPIRSISLVAERMAQGHYGERCAVDNSDEIGRLGATLDTLSGRLSQVIGNLNAEKSKLEKVLSAIGEGIIAIDVGGGIIHHNAAALNLLDIKSWDEPTPNPDIAQTKRALFEMLTAAVETGDSLNTSWKTIASRAMEAQASPVMDDEGNIIGAVCLIKDVTEAQKAEQMRRDFIANISHELRTPLTGIRGMVEPLMDGLMPTEKDRMDCYNVIYQETIRLEKLIRDMLDLSRLQSNRAVIELEPMPPLDLLLAVKRRMGEHAAAAGVELKAEANGNVSDVLGNEDRIIQVLIILADNAISFTPAGGSVTLFAKNAGERVEMGVSDTGCGIDPVDLPYIWERFYKADRSRMSTSGTGLGLAIAKMVVELMGGSVDVKTRVGHGSTFSFSLKAARRESK